MPLVRRILCRWLQFAGLATLLSGLIYLVAQQVWRHSANDPQIQMARDAGALLESGQPIAAVVPAAPVDMGRSLAPFVTVFNDAGVVVASSGRLSGQIRAVPAGVLDHVRERGEERVTWQPERGVRIAAVAVRYAGSPGGVVLIGRSLRETEERIVRFQGLIAIAWVAILAGLLVLVATSEYWLSLTSREIR